MALTYHIQEDIMSAKSQHDKLAKKILARRAKGANNNTKVVEDDAQNDEEERRVGEGGGQTGRENGGDARVDEYEVGTEDESEVEEDNESTDEVAHTKKSLAGLNKTKLRALLDEAGDKYPIDADRKVLVSLVIAMSA